MSTQLANIKNRSSRHCAFCKYWNDRLDTHIKHKSHDIWEYEPFANEYCQKKRLSTHGISSCPKYECKINT